MTKSVIKKLVGKAEDDARAYSKRIKTNLRAIAKAILQETKLEARNILPAKYIGETRVMQVKVETRQPVTAETLTGVIDQVKKYRGFMTVSPSMDGEGFVVSYYISKPFGWAG